MERRQFDDLAPADFERHPVWVGCHGQDEDEPWYDDTDEETFRPHTGGLPVAPDDGMFLVRASAVLADGTRLDGFLTPASAPDHGTMQPHVFAGDRAHGFWGGLAGVPEPQRAELRAAIERDDAETFPIHFAADVGLAQGVVELTVDGWSGLDLADARTSRPRWWRRGRGA